MVRRNLSYDFTFYCYTDDSSDIRDEVKVIDIPDDHMIDAWWNKLALFEEGMFKGTCLFFDLDVVIQNNIDHIIEYLDDDYLTKIKCYWKNEDTIKSNIDIDDIKNSYNMTNNSSVMLWRADSLCDIWNHFMTNPEYYMMKYRGIDRFIYHEGFIVKHFPKGEIYSRLYGFDLENGGVRETKIGPYEYDYELYKDDSYPICIFNSYGKEIDRPQGIHIDDSAYHGFEHHWK
jgi:hypothetical protein